MLEDFKCLKIGCLVRGVSNVDKSQFELVVRTIKALFHGNDSIDFYIHLWSDNERETEKYVSIAADSGLLIEPNSLYAEQITAIHQHHQHTIGSYGQISSSLSLKKVCGLFDSCRIKNGKEYDLIFITRPDCLFTSKLAPLDLNNEVVFFNKHGRALKSGDYCFIVNQENVKLFGGIWDALQSNPSLLPIAPHEWFHPYITDICKKRVELSSIEVCSLDLYESENCQIYKHIPGSQAHPNFFERVDAFLMRNAETKKC